MRPFLRPDLNNHLYLRDPQTTDLGRRVLAASVRLFDEIGFEAFTFKKLATLLGSTEASVYRYFENKHRLLNYLVSWHWSWLRFRVSVALHNVADPYQRLHLALRAVCEASTNDPATPDFDEAALHRVVMAEASKAYLTKEVDADNRAGLFREYKRLVAELVAVVQAVNPGYVHSHALVSTLLEAARNQFFYAQHLPSLTDPGQNVRCFLEHLALAALTGSTAPTAVPASNNAGPSSAHLA
ncbi:TetR/AcrR family transcriptional regulator [Hymenobacter glacialis]|uniref:TetR family transcriptional regulator n=1 Tax=Hymenobacter glacialis TaxID=1908236 RepID=A0A1G1SRQ5_9BACT|nr:TetR/AcrR family transcriptional regulator [Hymenobacter glacialis]OGX81267.1 TetR family transcriptional regulator [Hymenobacter glacialis]